MTCHNCSCQTCYTLVPDKLVAELKDWRRRGCMTSTVGALIDQIPDPPKPDVVKECARIYADASGTLCEWNWMRATLRHARELWGLEPLADLEEPK